MNTFKFITANERAEMIVEELGSKVTVEPYDDECSRVTFINLTDFDLLLLLHAGIEYGHSVFNKVR